MNVKAALKSDRVCKALTGLTSSEVKTLVLSFETNLLEARIKSRENRVRKFGGGRRGFIPEPLDKLLTALIYLKCYPTYDLLGFMIGLDRTRSCRWIKFLFPVLEQTLGRELVLPQRQIHSVEEFIRLHPEVKDVFVDGTDRRVQRPKGRRQQNKLYSGKRKSTTRKNIVVADENKKILLLSPAKSGRRHDKRLLDKMGIENLPQNVAAWVDTGFLGLAKIHPNIQMPKKRSKGNPLTEKDKEENRLISHFRVKAEHAVAGIKRLRAATDIYRNKWANFDDTLTLISAGIWNYHLNYSKIYTNN